MELALIWSLIWRAQRADPILSTLNETEGSAIDPHEMGLEEKALMKVERHLSLSKASANGEILMGVLFYQDRILLPWEIHH